ncbi:hypothetical protein [Streptomyces sp. SID12488]|uniref:hypothetical protein n=1 Tax=Streptomyces sp. SID12488 TaxID=2706040 RepID=UPI0013D9D87F|nr:hypothetical protein [Streptomyces sp. SID12488]NEA63929.1 hypothetical protein [Streptomyces sp. SID12488]
MDAGIAAVSGALAGSVATIGAAFATGWWQRENTRITARAAYRKDQRQPRYDAYKSLIRHGDALSNVFLMGAYDSDMADAAAEKLTHIEEAWLEISLLGPASVLTVSRSVHRKSQALVFKIESCAGTGELPGASEETANPNSAYQHYLRLIGEVEQLSMELAVTLVDFSEAAQIAIGNDGSGVP